MGTAGRVFVLFALFCFHLKLIRVDLIKKEHLSKDMKEVRGTRSKNWCKGPKVGPSMACLESIKVNVLKPREPREG